jgi:hypothetical protein
MNKLLRDRKYDIKTGDLLSRWFTTFDSTVTGKKAEKLWVGIGKDARQIPDIFYGQIDVNLLPRWNIVDDERPTRVAASRCGRE